MPWIEWTVVAAEIFSLIGKKFTVLACLIQSNTWTVAEASARKIRFGFVRNLAKAFRLLGTRFLYLPTNLVHRRSNSRSCRHRRRLHWLHIGTEASVSFAFGFQRCVLSVLSQTSARWDVSALRPRILHQLLSLKFRVSATGWAVLHVKGATFPHARHAVYNTYAAQSFENYTRYSASVEICLRFAVRVPMSLWTSAQEQVLPPRISVCMTHVFDSRAVRTQSWNFLHHSALQDGHTNCLNC